MSARWDAGVFGHLDFVQDLRGPRVFPPVVSHGGVRVSPVPLAWVVVYFVLVFLTLWWWSADGFFFTFLGALSCWNGWSVALDRVWFHGGDRGEPDSWRGSRFSSSSSS